MLWLLQRVMDFVATRLLLDGIMHLGAHLSQIPGAPPGDLHLDPALLCMLGEHPTALARVATAGSANKHLGAANGLPTTNSHGANSLKPEIATRVANEAASAAGQNAAPASRPCALRLSRLRGVQPDAVMLGGQRGTSTERASTPMDPPNRKRRAILRNCAASSSFLRPANQA